MSLSAPLSLKRGDSKPVDIPTYLDGVPYNAAAAGSILFTVKASKKAPDSQAKFQKALGAGITATATGVVIAVVYADTLALDEGTPFFWDVQAQDATGVHTVAEGVLSVEDDVTREVTTSVPVHVLNPPIPGGGAAGTVFTAEAGEALGSGRFVALNGAGKAVYASGPDSTAAVGFVREAYGLGQTCVIEKLGSLNGLAGLSVASTYYLAASGLISLTNPTNGVRQSVGVASAADTLQVTLSEPIYLA